MKRRVWGVVTLSVGLSLTGCSENSGSGGGAGSDAGGSSGTSGGTADSTPANFAGVPRDDGKVIGLDDSTAVGELTLEQVKDACTEINSAFLQETVLAVRCTLEGLGDEVRGEGDCETRLAECLDEAETDLDCDDIDSIPNCPDTSLAELEQCFVAQAMMFAERYADVNCDTPPDSLSDEIAVGACAPVLEKCPEVVGGDDGEGGAP